MTLKQKQEWICLETLTPDTQYEFQVRVKPLQGEFTTWSPWSQPLAFRTKPAGTGGQQGWEGAQAGGGGWGRSCSILSLPGVRVQRSAPCLTCCHPAGGPLLRQEQGFSEWTGLAMGLVSWGGIERLFSLFSTLKSQTPGFCRGWGQPLSSFGLICEMGTLTVRQSYCEEGM